MATLIAIATEFENQIFAGDRFERKDGRWTRAHTVAGVSTDGQRVTFYGTGPGRRDFALDRATVTRDLVRVSK